mgnify:CR=1 FL=1
MVLLLVGSTSFRAGDTNERSGDFVAIKDVSGIRLSTRWIPVSDHQSARQIKCEFTIGGLVSTAINLLSDDASFVKWMKGTDNYYRLKTVHANQWYSYIRFRVPWPFNDQDCIIRYNVTPDPTGKKTVVTLTGEPGFLRPFEGVSRIGHLEGSWIFTDLGNNKVRVEYEMFSNQPSKFPRWITDPIIQENLIESMDAFRKILREYEPEKPANHGTHS